MHWKPCFLSHHIHSQRTLLKCQEDDHDFLSTMAVLLRNDVESTGITSLQRSQANCSGCSSRLLIKAFRGFYWEYYQQRICPIWERIYRICAAMRHNYAINGLVIFSVSGASWTRRHDEVTNFSADPPWKRPYWQAFPRWRCSQILRTPAMADKECFIFCNYSGILSHYKYVTYQF